MKSRRLMPDIALPPDSVPPVCPRSPAADRPKSPWAKPESSSTWNCRRPGASSPMIAQLRDVRAAFEARCLSLTQRGPWTRLSFTSWVASPQGLNASADSPESLRGSARAHPAGECAEYSCERSGGVGDGMVKWFVVRACGPARLAQQQHPSDAASINKHTEMSTTDGTFGPYERRLLAPKTQDSIYLFTAMLRASSGRGSECQVLSCASGSGPFS
jgi:hypothetical protein